MEQLVFINSNPCKIFGKRQAINVIQVTPRRSYDSFQLQSANITDGDYIQSLDLYHKTAQLELMDTLRSRYMY
jgi:hypothetical protein